MFARVLPLFAVMGLGMCCGAIRLFGDTDRAIGVFNRFALYIGFPALIVASLASDGLTLPAGPTFYLIHLLGAVGILVIALLAGGAIAHSDRGAIALCAVFGNIAYLGIPVTASVYGDGAAGLAALSAALHLLVAMTLGPLVLVATSRGGGVFQALGRVVRQPLVWAPAVGLLLRNAPASVVGPVLMPLRPLGRAAGPIALFMIGLYLWQSRRELLRAGRGALTAAALKLLVFPAVVWGLVWLWRGSLSPLEARVAILQAAMPVAITTFSLAEEYRSGRQAVASAIVLSTVVALGSLPLVLGWLG